MPSEDYQARVIYTMELDGTITRDLIGDHNKCDEIERAIRPQFEMPNPRQPLTHCSRCGGFRGHGHVCDL